MSRRLGAVVIAAVVLGAGCGGGGDAGDEEAVRDVVIRYNTTRDGEAGCATLTQRFIEEGVGGSGEEAQAACANEWASTVAENPELLVQADDLAFGSIDIDGDVARAVVFRPESGNGFEFELRRIEGAWLIDGIDVQTTEEPPPASGDLGETGVFGDTGF